MSELMVIPTDSRGNPVELSTWGTTTQPSQMFVDWAGGGSSNGTGIPVTLETAFMVSAFWKGCLLITNAVAKCPLNIYSVSDGSRTINRRHPAFALTRFKPNNFQRAFDWKQQMQLLRLVYGNAYSVITWSGRGLPIDLTPIHPLDVDVYQTRDGIIYRYRRYFDDGTSEERVATQEDMLHISSMTPDGIVGRGLLGKAREVLGQLLAMQRYTSAFFGNNARPDIIIKHPARFQDKEARKVFKEDWQSAYGNGRGQGKVAVLDEGMTIEAFNQNASDSKYVEIYKQCIVEVSNYFGLPPSKLGDTSRNAYNSLEQDALAALSDCYEAELVNWEEACNDKLLSLNDQRTGANEFYFDRSSLLAADLKTRAEYVAKMVGPNTPIWTQDEARAFTGQNPLGGDAAKLASPVMAKPDATTQPVEDDPIDDETDDDATDPMEEALSAVVSDSMRRALTRTSKDVVRAFKARGIDGAMATVAACRDNVSEVAGSACKALAVHTNRDEKTIMLSVFGDICQILTGAISESSSDLDGFADTFTKSIQSKTKDLTHA